MDKIPTTMFDGRIIMERAYSISKIISDTLVEKARRESASKIMSSVHAGKIADCPRRTAFLLYNLHDDHADPVGLIHMKVGIAWHEILQSILMESGFAQSVEKKMPRLAEIVGMVDILIDDGDAVVPVEIKPRTKDKFQSTKEPDYNHVGQLMLYMHWTKAPYGYILYYNKNVTHYRADTYQNLPFIEFKIEYNEKIVEEFMAKSNEIMAAVNAGRLPDIPPNFGPDYCRYCPYAFNKCLKGMSYVNRRLKEINEKTATNKND